MIHCQQQNIYKDVSYNGLQPTQRQYIESDYHENFQKTSKRYERKQKNIKKTYIIVSILIVMLLAAVSLFVLEIVQKQNSHAIERLKIELKKDLEEKFKYKVQKTKIVIHQQIKKEIKEQFKKSFEKQLKKDLQLDVKNNLQQDVKQEIKKQLQGKINNKIEKQVNQNVENDFQKNLLLNLPKSIEKYHNHQVSLDVWGHTIKSSYINNQNLNQFKRVLWLQTEYPLQAGYWPNYLAGNSYIDAAKADGFELRIVNDLTAYDWLSNESVNFIKKTRHTSSVDLPVYDLLRLALLYEHGGVSIRLPNIILMNGIAWAADLIEGKIEEAKRNTLNCQLKKPQVIMLHKDTKNGIEFIDDFIVARPRARIFLSLLKDIAKITQEGKWPQSYYDATAINQDTQAMSFPGIMQALLNVYHAKKNNLCNLFGLESIHGSKSGLMVFIENSNAVSSILESQQSIQQKYGKIHMMWLRIESIGSQIFKVIRQRNISLAGINSLLATKLMMVEGNKWLAAAPKIHRNVHFCIVSLKPQESKEAQKSALQKEDFLGKQSFKSWNLVHFVKGLSVVSRKMSERTSLVNASVYQGLNLQRAVTKYCLNDSVVFLLDYDETLSSESDLQTLAKQFYPIGNFAAFLKIKTGYKLYKPSQNSQKRYSRKVFQIDTQILSDLTNSLRAFTAQSYLLIPYFALCQTTTGRYFDREIALMALIQLHGDEDRCSNSQQSYFMFRRLERFIDIPRRKILSQLTINSNRIKTVNTTGYEFTNKFRTIPICQSIERFWMEIVPIDNLVVFNNGREEKGLEARKAMPELIPRKIHQTWIRGEIPAFKQFLMKQIRDAHPDYEYFLWTEQNITRENFPQSYDVMQTLLKFDKKSPYNKMSMLSDFIRHEAAYIHGGFYFDTNYMLLNDFNLDKLLTYSFVAGTDEIPLNRADRNSGFFGVSPLNQRIYRLKNHRTLSSRRYFYKSAHVETGPGLFGHSLVGNEQLDQSVFLASLQQLYPGYHQPNKCEASLRIPDSEILFSTKKRRYLKNCSEMYPFAIGIDFFGEGASWMSRKWG